MKKSLVKGVVAAALALSFTDGIVLVAQAQGDIIKARQDNRKEITRIGGRELAPLVRENGSLTEIAAKADQLVVLHKAFAGMFPAGSDKGDTLAAPAIWTDRAGFDAINAKTVDAATKMAAAARAGDRTAVGDQFKVMGAACGECHQKYATKDPFKK
jgi:cytochrome c556